MSKVVLEVLSSPCTPIIASLWLNRRCARFFGALQEAHRPQLWSSTWKHKYLYRWLAKLKITLMLKTEATIVGCGETVLLNPSNPPRSLSWWVIYVLGGSVRNVVAWRSSQKPFQTPIQGVRQWFLFMWRPSQINTFERLLDASIRRIWIRTRHQNKFWRHSDKGRHPSRIISDCPFAWALPNAAWRKDMQPSHSSQRVALVLRCRSKSSHVIVCHNIV